METGGVEGAQPGGGGLGRRASGAGSSPGSYSEGTASTECWRTGSPCGAEPLLIAVSLDPTLRASGC